ncbi:MAG: hypothetical protein V7744_12410 [Pseudomonadales bacterium]
MKKVSKTIALIALISLTPLMWCVNSFAEDPPPPNFAAIEAHICQYNDGMGPADLAKVNKQYNTWADKNDKTSYTAWTMTPDFYSGEARDVVWLGAWPDGNEMGQGLQNWRDKGRSVAAEFAKVVSCKSHLSAGSVNIRAPVDTWPTPSGLAMFSDCHVVEGKTVMDSMAAHREWAKHLDATGSKAGMWAFFPGFGYTDSDTDYMIVVSHPDYISMGADWENYTNGQGWAKGMELAKGVVTCDSPRVYYSELVRNGGMKPN